MFQQLHNEVLAKDNNNVEKWKNEFDELIAKLNDNKGEFIKNVYAKFERGFAPYLTFVTLDALNREDWPNHISQNSAYVTFEINHITKKVEIQSSGHVYISKADYETFPQYKYLAMHSMSQIAKARNCKGLRKTSYKNVTELADKILTTFNNIMKEVADYTNGYPYKQGVKLIKVA